ESRPSPLMSTAPRRPCCRESVRASPAATPGACRTGDPPAVQPAGRRGDRWCDPGHRRLGREALRWTAPGRSRGRRRSVNRQPRALMGTTMSKLHGAVIVLLSLALVGAGVGYPRLVAHQAYVRAEQARQAEAAARAAKLAALDQQIAGIEKERESAI